MNRRDFLKIGTGMASAFVITSETAGLFARIGPDTPPVTVAVIGAGKQGRVILGELNKFPFVKVAAVCDVRESRLRSARRRAPDAKTYLSHHELLDREKDAAAVFLATPTHTHAGIAVDCLDADRHVYCEAPMEATIEGCRKIARAARKASTLFQVGLQFRSNPIYKLARSFMVSGAIQDVISLRGQYHNKTSWKIPARDPASERTLNWKLYRETSTGLPGEVGTHQFDVMSWFLNKLPLSVSGTGGVLFHKDGRDVADTVHCTLSWPDGLKMAYEATLANSYGGRFEEFMGSMGAIRLIGNLGWLFKEADAPTQGWEVYAVRQHFHKEEGITLIADATKLAKQGKLKEGVGLPHKPVYYGLADFLASVAGGKPSACPAGVGLRAAVVGIKAHEAVVTGKEIAFDEDWFKVT